MEIKSTTCSYYSAMAKRLTVLYSSSHKQQGAQIFWKMAVIVQNVCILLVEMESKEGAL